MANRGFIKDVGGSKRMRFVRAGYDANDMSVPPNQVIFDSQNIGALSVHTSGVVDVQTPLDGYIASWANLGYTPLAMVQFIGHPSSPSGTNNIGLSTSEWAFRFTGAPSGFASELDSPDNTGPRVYAYPTGLYMRMHAGKDGANNQRVYRFFVRFIVYRAAL